MKLRAYLFTSILVLVLGVVGALFISPPQDAVAIKDPVCDGQPGGGPYGRCWARGYFTDEARHSSSGFAGGNDNPAPPYWYYTDVTGITNWWVVPPQVQNNNPAAAEHFIFWVNHYLNQNYYECLFTPGQTDKTQPCYDHRRVVVVAAWTINVMLGYKGYQFGSGDAGIQNGVATARARFNDWATLVRRYQASGLIEWNGWRVYGHHTNTTGVGVGYNGRDIDAFWYGFYGEGPEFVDGIIFHDPNNYNDVFVINRSCWNAIGETLPPFPDYNLNAQIFSGAPLGSGQIVGGGNLVEPGKTYTLTARVYNSGNSAFDTSFSAFNLPAALRVQNRNPSLAEVQTPYQNNMDAPAFPSGGYNYFPSGGAAPGDEGVWCTYFAAASRVPCWVWNYTHIDKVFTGNWLGDTRFNFKVSDSATEGQQLCFRPYVSPQTGGIPGSTAPDYENQGTDFCVTVRIPREPYATTDRGSVQAGADWSSAPCLTNSNLAGDITGRVRGTTGSKGDYIVSAGGNINNFGSSGNVSSNSLKFGSNAGNYGQYGRVCRPDLAKLYLNDQPATDLNLGNSFSASAIPDGIYKVNGNVTLNGATIPQGRRSTLVVQGDVYITGNINYFSGPYNSLADIPSFGVIATGNIYINSGVTNLYGIYYAGTDHTAWNPGHAPRGIINTCNNGFVYPNPVIATSQASCNTQLTVQGALIANTIYFRRTFGDANTGTGAAETISYIPQLLLRPPSGLAGLSEQIRNDGERPPVF